MRKRVLAVIVLLTSFLSACSQPNITNERYSSNSQIVAEQDGSVLAEEQKYEDILIREEFYVLPGGYKVKSVVRANETLLFHGVNSDNQILGIAKFSVDEDKAVSIGQTTLLDIPGFNTQNTEMIYGTCAEDSSFYVLVGEFPPEYTVNGEYYTNSEYCGRYRIIEYSEEGTFINEYPLALPMFSFVKGIFLDRDKNTVIYGGNIIVSVDSSGSIYEFSVDEGSYIQSASACGDTIFFHTDSSRNYLYNPSEREIREITLYSTDGTEFPVGIDSTSISQGLNGECVICQNSRIYICSLDDGICKELYRWNYGAYYQSSPYICRLSDKCFASSISGEEYLLVTSIVQRPKIQRSKVIVALFDMEESYAGSAIRFLNATNSEYEYVEKIYNNTEFDRLAADMASDSPPDLLLFKNNLNTASNEFDDLYQYIDGDMKLSRDSFLPNFLDALTVNGEIHELWMDTYVNTIAAREKDIDGRIPTVEDYSRIVENSEQYQAVFQSYMSKENMLKWISEVGISTFIDKSNGACNFDNPYFKQLLFWCKLMGNDVVEGSDYPSLDVSEVLLTIETIFSPERLKSIRANFGEPFVFVGFPVGDGKGSFYSAGDGGCMAIPKNSKNKEGAWAFISYQLSEKMQIEVKYTLPVNISALKRKAEACLSENEMQILINLLNNTCYADNYCDSAIRNIIMDCGHAFLSGDKSIDETVSIIQDKVSILLSEQYG